MSKDCCTQREKIFKALKDSGLAGKCPIEDEVFDKVLHDTYEFHCSEKFMSLIFMFKITSFALVKGQLNIYTSMPEIKYLKFNGKEWVVSFVGVSKKIKVQGTIEPVSGWYPDKEALSKPHKIS